MGANRKNRRPPATSGPTSPTAPVSQKLMSDRVATSAAAAEMGLPWLPSTMLTPSS
jgi:hypothetical protein